MTGRIDVTVAYAAQDGLILKNVTMPATQTVEFAINASGLLAERNEIDLTKNKVGVYSAFVDLDFVPKDGDRIEIYTKANSGKRSLQK